jgi:hypothetical protein
MVDCLHNLIEFDEMEFERSGLRRLTWISVKKRLIAHFGPDQFSRCKEMISRQMDLVTQLRARTREILVAEELSYRESGVMRLTYGAIKDELCQSFGLVQFNTHKHYIKRQLNALLRATGHLPAIQPGNNHMSGAGGVGGVSDCGVNVTFSVGFGGGGDGGAGRCSDGPRLREWGGNGHSLRLSDLTIRETIGKGGFGSVFLVESKSNEFFAMKVINKKQGTAAAMEQRQQRRLLLEKEVIASTDHPFIVQLHCAFQTHRQAVMVMEYAAGAFSLYRVVLSLMVIMPSFFLVSRLDDVLE